MIHVAVRVLLKQPLRDGDMRLSTLEIMGEMFLIPGGIKFSLGRKIKGLQKYIV